VTQEAQAETAFIVIRRLDGSFYVTDDLSTNITVERVATIGDIKAGCRELADRIHMLELTDNIITALNTPVETQSSES
jgi:hypothetical protein